MGVKGLSVQQNLTSERLLYSCERPQKGTFSRTVHTDERCER
jgi:hypothetical protein